MKPVETISKTMLDLDTIKIYAINILGFLSTLTAIDITLKRAVLVATFTYTVVKTIAIIRKGIKEKDENNK